MSKSGIYMLTNTVNKKKYIGSAVYLASRKATHLCHLRRGSHANKKLGKKQSAEHVEKRIAASVAAKKAKRLERLANQ